MKRFGLARTLITSALVAAAFAPAAQAAGNYSNIYFFGDSLTDTGAYFGLPGVPQNNRWTTRKPDGSVNDLYADILARHYGFTLKSVLAIDLGQGKVTAGGNNFAEGGGVVLPGSLAANDPVQTKLVPNQIGAHLASNAGKADPNALYMVWVGNNDLAAALANPATASTNGALAAEAVVAQVKRLKAEGAKHIIVGNAVDISRTPKLTSQVYGQVTAGVASALYGGVNNATTANTIAGGLAQQMGQSGNAALIGLMSGAIQAANGQASTLTGMATAGAGAVKTTLNGSSTTLATYAVAATNAENAIATSYATTAVNAAVDALLGAGVINATVAAQLRAAAPAAVAANLVAPIQGKVGPAASAALASTSSLAGSVFNNTLNAGLGQVGDVVAIDAFRMMTEVLANPTAFGYSNVTGTACADASNCVQGAAGFTPGAENFFFADGFHPTPKTHALLAQVLISTLDAPYYAAQLAHTQPIARNAAQGVLDERVGQARSVGVLDTFARITRLSNDHDANSLGMQSNGRNAALTAGLDYQFNASTSIGMAFTQANSDTDFGNKAGGFDTNTRLLTGFVRYESGPISVAADASFGSARFREIRRNIQLGTLSRTEKGDTTGSQAALRVVGGYQLSLGDYSVTPTVSLAVSETSVGGYAEKCGDIANATSCSTSMRYDKQRIDSMLLGAGVKLNADWGTFKPYASVMAYSEGKDEDRTVRAAQIGQQASFSTEVYTPDTSYAVINVGTSASLSKSVNAYFSYSYTAGLSDEKRAAMSVGLQAAF